LSAVDTVRAYIDRHAEQRPQSVFLIAPETGQQLTFAELQNKVRDMGARFAKLGVPETGKVAFMLNNGLWSTLLFLAAMYNRRVIVPLNAVAGVPQLAYVLDHSDSQVLFINEEYRNKIGEVLAAFERPLTVIATDEDKGPEWPEPEPGVQAGTIDPPAESDDSLLLYTSGTTGLPKGAVLTHKAVISGGKNVVMGHGLTEDDRALCVLPIYHINGAMVTVSAPLVSGSSVVMPHRFKASQYWRWVAEHACTWSSVVPTIIKYLLDRAAQEPYAFGDEPRLKQFRFGRSASAPLPPVVLEQWEQTFHVPMIETLGLTETAGTVLTNPMPPAPHKIGSVGLPVGNEGKIIDKSEHEVPVGEEGEIVIRGANVLTHYYKNPEATRAAFTKDGWFRTGDLARRDRDGYVFITGRSKELIIKGGENIAPREIDEALYKHEAVLEAAAVGVPDDNYGQEVIACVVRRAGFECSEQELIVFCAKTVGDFKAPRRIYFMDDLPKGPSGKIQRLKLPDLIKVEQRDAG